MVILEEYGYDFDMEFTTDEEVEEMMDSMVAYLGDQIVEDEDKISIINPMKIHQVLFTYKVLKYMMKNQDVKISYKLHEPFKSVGYVSVSGKNLIISNIDWFLQIVKYSSNMEVYPKTDGTIQLNFTFHGLTKSIEN